MDDHKQDEAVQQAAAAGAAAGSAARGAMVEFGSMGIKGLMQTVGNMTAMVVITVLMIVLYRDLRSMQVAESMYQREEMRRIQQEAQGERNRLWEVNARQYRDQMDILRTIDAKVQKVMDKGGQP